MYKSVPLPYYYSALEPYIDAETMNIHFNTHYMGYIKNLNEEIKKNNYKAIPIRELIMTLPIIRIM